MIIVILLPVLLISHKAGINTPIFQMKNHLENFKKFSKVHPASKCKGRVSAQDDVTLEFMLLIITA